jgi:hypothetical protein
MSQAQAIYDRLVRDFMTVATNIYRNHINSEIDLGWFGSKPWN